MHASTASAWICVFMAAGRHAVFQVDLYKRAPEAFDEVRATGNQRFSTFFQIFPVVVDECS